MACGVTTVVVSAATGAGGVFSISVGPIVLPLDCAADVAGGVETPVVSVAPGTGVGTADDESVGVSRLDDGKIIGVTTITSAVRMSARKKRLSIRKEPEELRNRIVAARSERVAAAQSLECEPTTACGSVALEGLDRIRGATRIITARGRQQRRKDHLISAHDKDQQVSHHDGWRCGRRMSAVESSATSWSSDAP